MELYSSHTFFNTKAKKPWFNTAFSRAVNEREAAHQRYRSYSSAEIKSYIFLPVIMPNLFSKLVKTLSLENVKVLPTLALLVISNI